MKGTIEFELYIPETGEVVASIYEDNIIMDNVLNSLAGIDRSLGNYQIVLGTVFNDDELNTKLNAMPGPVFTSDNTNTAFLYNAGDKHFIVGCEINPLQANGNIIAVGILSNGKLYNRAIFKRYGTLLDGTAYDYKVVGTLGNQVSPESDPVVITTASNANQNSNKITWQSNGRSDFYQVYRKLQSSSVYHLLATTSKLFIYDDGFLNETSTILPSPVGNLPRIVANAGQPLTDPVPYAVQKTQEFAAKVRVKIQF